MGYLSISVGLGLLFACGVLFGIATYRVSLCERYRVLGTILAILACASACGAPVSLREDRIRWDHEPIVAVDAADLLGVGREAMGTWGWGRFAGVGCAGADVCIERGFIEPGSPLGEASWDTSDPSVCTIHIFRPSPLVAAHEVGHCYGLGHSTDSRSIMFPTLRLDLHGDNDLVWVTYADRAALRNVIEGSQR